MSFKSFMTKQVKIYKRTVGTGSNKENTWSLREVTKGMKGTLKNAEKFANDGKTIIADDKVFLEITTVENTDRILMDSKIYDIVGRPDNIMGLGHHLEVKLKLLPPGTDTKMGI
jgi:hypothetical protein